MRRTFSLRQRLFVLILGPLLLMALLLGYWRFNVAQETASELFDRSLLATALAVSRDVAISGGDALLPSTRDLIGDASGGDVFYHVTGPGGIYITGYAYPPAMAAPTQDPYLPVFAETVYRGEPVRAVRMTERQTIDNLTGDMTVTVWQRLADRNAFARELAIRAGALMGALLTTLAFVVWFGVHLGLRPLVDLQNAIAMRSPDDLGVIRRPVPEETRGIVRTLNRLLTQVEQSINAHQVFISNAAHQLRNPAAAVQSMAETLQDAKDDDERRRRIDELVFASRSAARVAEQLLSLDRLRHGSRDTEFRQVDLRTLTEDTCAQAAAEILARGLSFEFDPFDTALPVRVDTLFVSEAIKNLIDNAAMHGGPDLTKIVVTLGRDKNMATVTVMDDGVGLSPDMADIAFSRFSQIEPSEGSGLGLAIATSVAERHGGSLRIDAVETGASLTLSLPLADTSSTRTDLREPP